MLHASVRRTSVFPGAVSLILMIEVTGAASCYAFSVESNSFFAWGLSFFTLTLMLNTTSTLLIASRIWYSSRRTNCIHGGKGNSILWKLLMIVSGSPSCPRDLNKLSIQLVESAAVYSCFIAAMIGTFASQNTSQYITLDTLSPMVGITVSRKIYMHLFCSKESAIVLSV